MFKNHLPLFFCELSAHISSPFFIGLLVSYFLCFWKLFYIAVLAPCYLSCKYFFLDLITLFKHIFWYPHIKTLKQKRVKEAPRASLVAQWLRIHLPMQGTRVRALVREDPTCRRATKPVRHSYWACALEPASHNYWGLYATATEAHMPRARAPQQEKPPQWEARAPQWRVAPACRN